MEILDAIAERALQAVLEKVNPSCFTCFGIVAGTLALVGLSTIAFSLLVGEAKLGYEGYWDYINYGVLMVVCGSFFAWVLLFPLLKWGRGKRNDSDTLDSDDIPDDYNPALWKE